MRNRQIVSVLDQGFQAGGNLIVTVLIARWLSVEGFATVAAMLSIWFFFEAVQRTGILVPYIGEVPAIEEKKADHTLWLYINVLLLTGAVAVLFVLGFVLPPFAAKSAHLAAFLVPSAGLFFYGKRLLYHAGSPLVALGVSLLNIGFIFVGLAAIFHGLLPRDASAIAVLYGASFFVSSAVAFFCLRHTFGHRTNTLSAIRFRMSLIYKMSLGAIASYVYNNGMQLLLVLIAPIAEAAAFAATRVLVRPVILIIQAVMDIERSEASRLYNSCGDKTVQSFLRQLMLKLAFVLFPLGMVLFFYTPQITHFLFDGKYDEFAQVGQMWLLALVPQFIALPLDIRQSSQNRANALLIARCGGALACLACFTFFYFWSSDVTAAIGVACVASGRAANLIVLWLTQNVWTGSN